jgi:CheY-like chemotaxis protein
LAEMKANESTQDIPILVVTIVEDKQKGMALGAYDYCVKPVERKWLLKKLKELTQKRILEKILVIDDEEVSRYLIRNYLSDLPYTLIEAADGEEAVALTGKLRPDVVLMDLRMPGVDGVSATALIHERWPQVHVLVLTTYDADADIVRAVEAGATSYILKDAPRDDLFRAVRSTAA